MSAGRQDQRLFANFDAIEHFTKALHSAERLPATETARQRQESHVALGELLTTTSQYDAALDHLQQALDLASALGDADAQAHACRWFARLHDLRGDYARALEWVHRVLDALGVRDTVDAAEALITMGLIYTRLGDLAAALDCCQQSLKIASHASAIAVGARAHGLLGMIAQRRGDGRQAIMHLQTALDLYSQAENIHGQGLVHNLMAQALFDLGRWTDADYHYRRAREVFHQIGDVYNRALGENNIGTVARFQGRLDEAQQFFVEALRSLAQLGGSPYLFAQFNMNLADVFIARGDLAAARRHLAISWDYAAQAHISALLPDFYRLSAEAALLDGALDAARADARQSLDAAKGLGMHGDEGHALRALGEVAAAHGETEQAERDLRDSMAILQEVGQEYGTALSQLALARILVTQDRPNEAQQALDGCIPVFERLEAALDLERARALQEAMAVPS
jgi:tetratricopeptide (TPR) repeat protein